MRSNNFGAWHGYLDEGGTILEGDWRLGHVPQESHTGRQHNHNNCKCIRKKLQPHFPSQVGLVAGQAEAEAGKKE
jgi:hypothetical protein